MPERIPELDDFVNQTAFVRGLPADEIRRRGDRRRAVRRGSVAGLAVLAVTALGIGVWASPLMDNVRQPQWATTASPSPTGEPTGEPTTQSPEPTSTPVQTPSETPSEVPSASVDPTATAPEPPTWANVPDVLLVYPEPPELINTADYEGMGQDAKGLCDPGEWGNPTTVLHREFTPVDGGVSFAIVMGYPSEAEAAAGYDLIRTAAENCPSAEGTPYVADTTTDPALPANDADQSVYIQSVHIDGWANEDERRFNVTHLVQDDERVLWQVDSFIGQDLNCSVLPDDDAMQCVEVATTPEVLELLRK